MSVWSHVEELTQQGLGGYTLSFSSFTTATDKFAGSIEIDLKFQQKYARGCQRHSDS